MMSSKYYSILVVPNPLQTPNTFMLDLL